MKRRKHSAKQREHTARSSRLHAVPSWGIGPPQRVGWKAILDLEPGPLRCVQWLLRKMERNQHVGPRAMARECGIRPATAVAFLHSPWVPWAEFVLSQPGNGSAGAQALDDKSFASVREALRETLGNDCFDAQAETSQQVMERRRAHRET